MDLKSGDVCLGHHSDASGTRSRRTCVGEYARESLTRRDRVWVGFHNALMIFTWMNEWMNDHVVRFRRGTIGLSFLTSTFNTCDPSWSPHEISLDIALQSIQDMWEFKLLLLLLLLGVFMIWRGLWGGCSLHHKAFEGHWPIINKLVWDDSKLLGDSGEVRTFEWSGWRFDSRCGIFSLLDGKE